jgi:hypothetical protein
MALRVVGVIGPVSVYGSIDGLHMPVAPLFPVALDELDNDAVIDPKTPVIAFYPQHAVIAIVQSVP